MGEAVPETALISDIIKDLLSIAEKNGERAKVEKKVEVPNDVAAPIKKGDVIGKVVCYYDGKRQGSINLLAAQDVEYYSFWDNLLNYLRDFWKGLF